MSWVRWGWGGCGVPRRQEGQGQDPECDCERVRSQAGPGCGLGRSEEGKCGRSLFSLPPTLAALTPVMGKTSSVWASPTGRPRSMIRPPTSVGKGSPRLLSMTTSVTVPLCTGQSSIGSKRLKPILNWLKLIKGTYWPSICSPKVDLTYRLNGIQGSRCHRESVTRGCLFPVVALRLYLFHQHMHLLIAASSSRPTNPSGNESIFPVATSKVEMLPLVGLFGSCDPL